MSGVLFFTCPRTCCGHPSGSGGSEDSLVMLGGFQEVEIRT